MLFCSHCNSRVGNDDLPMVRDGGKCTRCRLKRIPSRPAPLLVQARAQTVLGHGILIGVPAVAVQRQIGDAPAASAVPTHS